MKKYVQFISIAGALLAIAVLAFALQTDRGRYAPQPCGTPASAGQALAQGSSPAPCATLSSDGFGPCLNEGGRCVTNDGRHGKCVTTVQSNVTICACQTHGGGGGNKKKR